MRFGTCTWVWGDEPLEKIASRVVSVGLDGVELFGDTALDPRAVCTVLQANGLGIFSLTPANVDLCHPDSVKRAAALDYYLRLVEFAFRVGAPIVSCHGLVGRVRALESQAKEMDWFANAVAEIAAPRGIRIAIELLNRYESHLLNDVQAGLKFLRELNLPNVGLLLDAYHMNIEEADPADAIRQAGDRLFLFHAADSNRRAVGRGHTNFGAIAQALHAISYSGDIIFECVVPGPDPFSATKDLNSNNIVENDLRESYAEMKRIFLKTRIQ